MVASLETLDNVRDRLISNGLGGSALGVQALQRQGLPDLGSSLSEQNAIRSGTQAQRLSDVKTRLMATMNKGMGAPQQGPDFTKPFALAQSKDSGTYKGGTAVGIKDPRTGKFAISTIDTENPLAQAAIGNKVYNNGLPVINNNYASTLKTAQYNPNQVLEVLGSKDTNLQGNSLEDIIKRLLG